jgi:hypothetical protein
MPAATAEVAHATAENVGASAAATGWCRDVSHLSPRIAAPFARAMSRASTLQVFGGMRRAFGSDSAIVLAAIGHHMIRLDLCSASSRLSLRSTLQASALTPPARSSKVALM